MDTRPFFLSKIVRTSAPSHEDVEYKQFYVGHNSYYTSERTTIARSDFPQTKLAQAPPGLAVV